ncbi:putative PurR-regulated permease PerM [Kribbella pratensis]|uniref:PurR-regulated permease PerM n=1 Tax=Kribbella pratensis TaxID=2512112 RepID=A0ABY2FKX3_9ACTN|nr:putative PurR-regulated permease PerM [Kribbella pratensis]
MTTGRSDDDNAPGISARRSADAQEAAIPDDSVDAVRPDPMPADDAEPPAAPSPAPDSVAVEPVVVPRWVQAIVVAVALFALTALARAAAPVLMIFLVAAVVALIVNPLVVGLQRARVPRGIAIVLVFLGFFVVMGGAVALLVRQVAVQLAAFQDDLPRLIDSANGSLANLQQWLDQRGIGIQIKRPGETALDTLQASVLRGSGDVVAFTRDLVTTVVEAGFVLILTLVVTIYMLIYAGRIGALTRQVMPSGDDAVDDDYPARVQQAVSGYVRGQLAFSLIMGLSAGVSLWVFGALGIFPSGKTYAVFFGVFYGLMELIPYLGPVLGAAPAILVALFQGDLWTALWLLLLFVVLQQLEGHIVAPQVFSHSLRINPLLVMFALLLGGHLHGIAGALVALPLAAIARETVLYLRHHLMLEPWGTPSAATLRARPLAPTISAGAPRAHKTAAHHGRLPGLRQLVPRLRDRVHRGSADDRSSGEPRTPRS